MKMTLLSIHLWTLLATVQFISVVHTGISVRMSDTAIKIYDNTNLTLTCTTEQVVIGDNENNTIVDSNTDKPPMGLSVRARMVLTLLQIPRGGQMHQVHGVLHCDPLRTSCESEFNIAVDCITDRIKIAEPSDTLETACQLVDENVCSYEWLQKHRGDCFALGKVTIIKGPKLGERCVHRNESSVDQLLPCGEHQYCNTIYGICVCIEQYIPQKKKCVPEFEDQSSQADSLNRQQPSTVVTTQRTIEDTIAPILPPVEDKGGVEDNENTPTNQSNTRQTSKALVIFLLIVAILLCIALAVVVLWRISLLSYSRSRSRTAVSNVAN